MLRFSGSGTALRQRALIGPLLVALMLVCVPSASAQVVDRERFSEAISEDFELCGIAVHEEGSLTGAVHFRVGKGEVESKFFQHLTYKLASTITNTANGRFMTVVAPEVIQDVKATHLEGTLFEITVLDAGQPWVI